MSPPESPARVGITCRSDHPTFGTVGDVLAERGYAVSYLDAERPIDRGTLSGLSAFVIKHTRPASVRALVAAERMGVPTWNSATGVLACVSRFSQLCALSGVGFPVPAASRVRPAGPYVAKGLYHWQPGATVNGEGAVYEELLDADPVDHKYYVVDDGGTRRTVVLRAASKLRGEKRVLGGAEPVAEHVDRIEALMDRLGMRGVGVDLVRTDDGWYAVDLNPCPGFEGTGFEDALADSVESCLER